VGTGRCEPGTDAEDGKDCSRHLRQQLACKQYGPDVDMARDNEIVLIELRTPWPL